ncbi:MAG: hypothetical protein Kow0080_25690 [Candidatus Promineifilaceae bacterium]
MSRKALIPLGILGVALLLFLVITTDGLPLLRGPAPDTAVWHWPYHLRPVNRWWLSLLAALGITAVTALWQRKKLSTWTGVTLLALSLFFLQIGILYADNPNIQAELINRTLAIQTNGYFWTAANTPNLGDALRTYPQQMAAYESDHTRTHPPGLVVANWAVISLLERLPGAAKWLAQPAWMARCTDLWLFAQPPYTAAALVVWAWLPLLLAALSVWPAYLLGEQVQPGAGMLTAVFVAATPALTLFAPLPDQIYVLLTLLTLLFFDKGLRNGRLHYLFLSGLLLSISSFLSLGNAALGFVLLLVGLWHWWQADTKNAAFWWRGALTFTIGAGSIWGVYWLGWHVPPWEIAHTGMAQHYNLATGQRSYTTWLWGNLVDFALFTGLAAIFGFGQTVLQGIKPTRPSSPAVWAVAGAVLLILLDLSGSTRGEVGRIWLFLMPFAALGAAVSFHCIQNYHTQLALVGGQLLLLLAMGLSWQTISAVIVQPTPPNTTFLADSSTLANANSLNIPLGEEIMLSSYQWNGPLLEAGETLTLSLFWRAEKQATRPYTVFIHLVDDSGHIIAQQDNWPVQGSWPPTCWQKKQAIHDTYQLVIPPETLPGTYQLYIGMYDSQNGSRLTTPAGQDAIILPRLMVK